MKKMNVNVDSTISELTVAGMILDDGNAADFKTGDWKNQEPVHDKEKCKSCMLCVPACPEGCMIIEDDKMQGMDLSQCKGCGVCAKVCPFKAIEMKR